MMIFQLFCGKTTLGTMYYSKQSMFYMSLNTSGGDL